MNKKLTRREFLRYAGLTSGAVFLAACAPQVAPVDPTSPPAVAATTAPGATPAPTTAPPAVKPIVITHVESWFGVPQYQDIVDPINQMVSELAQSQGINVEIRSMILDDHQAKYPLLYTSGADFTTAFDAPWHLMPSLRNQGALLALDDLFAQHGQKVVEGVSPRVIEFNKFKGQSFGIPIAYIYGEVRAVVLRQDLLEKYGVVAPDPNKGWASVKPYLEAIRDNESNMIPLASRAFKGDCMADFNQWVPNRTPPAGNELLGFTLPDWREGQKFMDFEDVKGYSEGAELLHEFWKEGLVPKVAISNDSTVSPARDYFYPGLASAVVANGMGGGMFTDTIQLQSYNPEARAWAYDTTGATTGKFRPLGSLKQWNFIVFNSQAAPEKQEAAMQFWNWLYSGSEQRDLWLFGVEGENYLKGEGDTYKDIEGIDQARNYRKEWYISGVHGKFRRQPADAPKEYVEHMNFLTTESNWDFTPYEAFELDMKPLDTLKSQVEAAFDEAAFGWRTGEMSPDESKARFKQMMDAAGRQQLKDGCQKQLDEWIKANM
jgi:putative aldouronate transport system substrate-binding protein